MAPVTVPCRRWVWQLNHQQSQHGATDFLQTRCWLPEARPGAGIQIMIPGSPATKAVQHIDIWTTCLASEYTH